MGIFMRNFVVVCAIATMSSLFTAPIFGADSGLRLPGGSQDVNYSWAGKRLAGAYWGLAFGDVDKDGAKEAMLLLRRGVKIGKFAGEGFHEDASCNLPGLAEGARIYAYDLDNDGGDEIVVSAVEEGLPSSLALKFENGSCRVLVERARMSVRVALSDEGKKILMGQGWSSGSFFFGPIYEIKFEGGKFKEYSRVDIKKGVKLFQFAWVPGGGGAVVVRGYNPLEFYEKSGKKFKSVWRTGERFGGTINQIESEQRDALGQVEEEFVRFDIPPLVRAINGSFEVIAYRHILPVKNVIGLKPAVSGAEIVSYAPDPAIVLRENARTLKLPGAVTDIVFGEFADGKKSVFVLMQNDPSMFRESESATILAFDM